MKQYVEEDWKFEITVVKADKCRAGCETGDVFHCQYGCLRNRGYASEALLRASKIAQESNCYKVMLLTGSKLESTLKFYEKGGFSQNEKTAFIKRF